MTRFRVLQLTMLALCGLLGNAALARTVPPSEGESFTIGTSGSVCDAQSVGIGAARQSIFERRWAIVCRDVGRPIGNAYSLRGGDQTVLRLAAVRQEALSCAGESRVELAPGVAADVADCRGASGLAWKSYRHARGNRLYVVEGLSAYDGALRLALRNLIEDRVVPGEVQVVSTGSGAGSIGAAIRKVADPAMLIGQGYRSNNAGAYVEAAELFAPDEGNMVARGTDDAVRLHEMAINRALQLSNLGEFEQAGRLFADAQAMRVGDPIQSRLARNYRAIDALNQGDLEGVTLILDEPVVPLAVDIAISPDQRQIDRDAAAGLNAAPTGQLAGVVGLESRLSVPERVTLIDAQADQLRGTVLRLSGRLEEAQKVLSGALARSASVREGRVLSTVRLNAQILSELSQTYEARGRAGDAEAALRRALRLVEAQYPDSASVNNARARFAGFLARHGQRQEARAIYRGIVDSARGTRNALVGMTNLMRPYFDLLIEDAPGDPSLLGDFFAASQLVERPGAADAMALLARRLAGGDADASALFRQSQEVARELERTRVILARQTAAVNAGASDVSLGELTQRQQRLLDTQSGLINALAGFPQYRAVANRSVELDELRGLLQSGEAYLKLVQLGDAVYALYVSGGTTRAWRAGKSATEIADLVAALRNTISQSVDGNQQTFAFDVDSAATLYDALLGPVAGEIASVRHLLFEPDGAMLQLPINLLTGDAAGIAAYHRRAAQKPGSAFDFTGIEWLGSKTAVSTALSAATFRDARRAPASTASRGYLGLGENVPLGPVTEVPSTRGSVADAMQEPGCDWPAAIWNRPISARELRDASQVFGRGDADLMIDGAFTDTAVMQRADLSSYRVLHFATHGLVTPPRDGCPARPALLTSFGGADSDGLLGFSEIFDLKLDADLVILSACDTAAQASIEATREAGVSAGGGQAFDGLVRAFIAAGGRQVIASHWPAPDDFGATRRLFTSFFLDRGDSVAGALQKAQRALIDDPQTSHPFYWAGFAVIGDGAQPLRVSTP